MKILHKKLEPEDVLRAVAFTVRNEFPNEYRAEITCKFVDDYGSVEVYVTEKNNKNLC
jgi:hypothetical protein